MSQSETSQKSIIDIPTGAVFNIKKIGNTESFDGHSLRAYAYFKEQMPEISQKLSKLDEPGKFYKVTIDDKVEYYHKSDLPEDINWKMKIEEISSKEYEIGVINSIKDKKGAYRQMSKAPTFALTYGGSYKTLMNNCGFSEEMAKKVEHNYHHLYTVSDQWVKSKLNQAKQDGYVTVAFGLKLRTPLLVQGQAAPRSLYEAEGRTAGNALGQSWGLLNSRAMNVVMQRVRANGHELDILPVAAIHDCNYYLVRNNASLISWFNSVVREEAEWNNHPDIYHDEVGLGGDLDIFYPSWATPLTLPADVTQDSLVQLVQRHLEGLDAT